ncbi:MAG: RagB/SusD family nutrient uptake outer membrane protein [Bacteroidales bacterium]|nr:RagB/SusD family nutrient uptake outer membrane protein [Bacteroidales bacterium]
MRNMMKPVLAAAASMVLLQGCLEVIQPHTSYVTDEQVDNALGAFDKFTAACTNALTGSFIYGGTTYVYVYDFGYPSLYLTHDVMGQDIVIEDSANETYITWYNCATELNSHYAACHFPWQFYYDWIWSCNKVIDMAGEEPAEDEHYGLGIAYCMRAMFYMDLARLYSQKTYTQDLTSETVPIVTETTTTDDLFVNPRATNEEIWSFIMSDLDRAEDYIADYSRPDKTTPDLSVVYGMKARAYLTMEDWPNAELYARKAQEGYTLLTEEQYLDRDNGFNSPNSSWMFCMTYQSSDPNIISNSANSCWGSQMIVEVGSSGCGYAASYGAPKRIDEHLYSTIPQTDWRRKCFLDFALDDMDSDEALEALSEYSDVPQDLANTAAATISGRLGGIEVKFRPNGGEHTNQYNAFLVSVPIMRVEEMCLIEAEAAGMQDEARGIQLLTDFAKTRDPEYVYGSHCSEAYGNDATGDFRNEVWWQRRVELWGEGFATFDIKRLDKGIIRSYAGTNHIENDRWNYGGYTSNAGNVHPDWMDLVLPQTETNYNTLCTQNPTPQKPSSDSPEYQW